MLEFPDVFAVGVAGAPLVSVHHMYPDYHWTGWHGVPDYGDGCTVRPFTTARPRNYDNMDATLQIDRLRGRLLLIAGELDENCPVGPTMQLYAAAVEADRSEKRRVGNELVSPCRSRWSPDHKK